MIGPSPISLIFRLKDLCCKTQLIDTCRILPLQGLERNLKIQNKRAPFLLVLLFQMAAYLTSTHARPTDDEKRNVVLKNVF